MFANAQESIVGDELQFDQQPLPLMAAAQQLQLLDSPGVKITHYIAGWALRRGQKGLLRQCTDAIVRTERQQCCDALVDVALRDNDADAASRTRKLELFGNLTFVSQNVLYTFFVPLVRWTLACARVLCKINYARALPALVAAFRSDASQNELCVWFNRCDAISALANVRDSVKRMVAVSLARRVFHATAMDALLRAAKRGAVAAPEKSMGDGHLRAGLKKLDEE